MDCVRYVINKRKRLGLASTFLAERINPGDELKVYVQKAHGRCCAGSSKPDHHDRTRHRRGAVPRLPARSPRHRRAGQELAVLRPSAQRLRFLLRRRTQRAGLLTRLSLAWSRDGDKKFYVQDRMREVGRELWTWLAEGANIYVCGDAKRMAKDVERALVDIVAQFGRPNHRRGRQFCRGTEEKGRFQQDVY